MQKFLKLFTIGSLAALPILVSAQFVTQPLPRFAGDFTSKVNTIGGYAIGAIILLAVLFIIYAAFLFLTAQGSADKLGEAKSIIIYAVVAIAVALLASVIVNVAIQIFS